MFRESLTRKPRPSKPRPDFPLFPHRTNRWCKKIRGQSHYFGKVDTDPSGEAALERWLDQKDDLLAGRKPRGKVDALTVGDLCNRWLEAKQARVRTGELSQRTWDEYRALCQVILAVVERNRAASDLGPEDFAKLRAAMAERWGPARLGTGVIVTRSIWRWAFEAGLIAMPQRFGDFSRPNAKTIRVARAAKGPQMFTPEEIRKLLEHAGVNLKAMILLGVNAGLGNTDVALLPITAVDLTGGWLHYARAKTAISRRSPLWPETLAAIKAVLAHRPKPQAKNEELLFLNSTGGNYVSGRRGTAVWKAFSTAAEAAGVTGRSFYDLRRSFQTVADGAKDPVAASAIMGHAPKSGDMASVYRQMVPDERLQAVVDVVHGWLFATQADDTANGMGGGI